MQPPRHRVVPSPHPIRRAVQEKKRGRTLGASPFLPRPLFSPSAIGVPVNRPRIVDVKLGMHGSAPLEVARPQIESVISDLLASVDSLWKPIIERQISRF